MKITAAAHTSSTYYLRLEATDGMTYTGVNDSRPGERKRRMIYETWATDGTDVGTQIDWVRMPRAVRDMMRAKFGHPHYATR